MRQTLIQTQPYHQSEGGANADEDSHDHDANRDIPLLQLIGNTEIDDMAEDFTTKPHKENGERTPKDRVDEIEDYRVNGVSHLSSPFTPCLWPA
jgi:hypothetical protein